MTRHKLPDRRRSVTTRTRVVLEDQSEWTLLLTIGFRDDGSPAEVFCSSFKVGTAMNSIVSDACILLSRLYQHGDSPADIAASLCEPKSLVGQIAVVVASTAREKQDA